MYPGNRTIRNVSRHLRTSSFVTSRTSIQRAKHLLEKKFRNKDHVFLRNCEEREHSKMYVNSPRDCRHCLATPDVLIRMHNVIKALFSLIIVDWNLNTVKLSLSSLNIHENSTICDHTEHFAVFKTIIERPWKENEKETVFWGLSKKLESAQHRTGGAQSSSALIFVRNTDMKVPLSCLASPTQIKTTIANLIRIAPAPTC